MPLRLTAKEAAALVGARKEAPKGAYPVCLDCRSRHLISVPCAVAAKSAPAGRPERKQLIPPQEGELCRIIVPGDPKTLSLNARLHWQVRRKLNEKMKTAAGYAWWQAGKPEAKGKVRVHLIVRRCRVMDADNILSGAKSGFDGLFKGCVTKDDSAQYVEIGQIAQQTGREWVSPEIEFVIVEV